MNQEVTSAHEKTATASLHDLRFLRAKQVLELIPVSKAHWYKGVKDGIFPSPVKLSPGIVAWKVSDIRSLLERLNQA